MAHTYGMSVREYFIEKKHKYAEVKVIDGIKYAGNIFGIIIRAGEEVNIRKTISKGPYTPTDPDQTSLRVFCTEEIDPKYTTDIDCKHVGTLRVVHANNRSKKNNRLEVSFIFGDTELLVKAVNIRTNEEFYSYMDCL
ncbi:heat shock 70 kDa protein 12A-like [Ruditapes philippinarum]|uniref:heat shock 70 kDa protein 12A-like n=1 Tax=Ruditapes philippinarum TaxID=129788 RepID=UPI00295AD722|nr:heat shock 70 kDa protein 12A-like [Ruditapes philippinarum]